ncbi:GIY-YIG nuclease family protein [Gaetbulibacter sp. M235]|uniref:GIY-YIG nuclease family protein n=1 Tax=Gaetbulibacter sp. M235 TaxID=3126510 RepID=UPI00374F83BC
MKLYYVYIVRCSDNSLYTGITNNIERRVYEHNVGVLKSTYTYKRRPVILVLVKNFWNLSRLLPLKRLLKNGVRKRKKH